jgi:glutamine cyclotransferase
MKKHSRALGVVVAVVVALAAGFAVWAQLRPSTLPRVVTARIVAEFPHDPTAFTQGLVVESGALYESTGQYGHSSIRRVDLRSGRIEQIAPLNFTYFGEGMTILDGRIYQLTWKSQTAFVYDLDSFEQLETRRYRGEGWGLTDDGVSLIASNGTATLTYYDPETFAVTRTIEVRDEGAPVPLLNELEFVDGEIWANVWYEDRIVRVASGTGEVLGWIDLGHLVPRTRRGRDDVLNGIAYDADTGQIFVTGKNWASLFEVELVPR